jgi:hypothetical protein
MFQTIIQLRFLAVVSSRILAVVVLIGVMTGCQSMQERVIQFSGYDWVVRPSGIGNPGPNYWDQNNVWVDGKGDLHLVLTGRNGRWECAEVYTRDRLGYGRYQFSVIGRLDRLDPNVVVGLFNYPPEDVGPDQTHEIDIEFTRWGDPTNHVVNYTSWPASKELGYDSTSFPVVLEGDRTTHRFTWDPMSVVFESLHGHRDDSRNRFASYTFKPEKPDESIAQKPMPVYINLWCFQGKPPADGQEVELVVRSFRYTPLRLVSADK